MIYSTHVSPELARWIYRWAPKAVPYLARAGARSHVMLQILSAVTGAKVAELREEEHAIVDSSHLD